jgi:hypothetical protein
VRAGQHTRRRSLVVVISDGMEEPARWLPALSAFAKRGADLTFVHLYDRGEWGLAFAEPAVFFSPEGGEDIAVDPVGARATFAKVARDYVREVKGGVVRFGGRYLQAASDDPLDAILRRIIAAPGELAPVAAP